MPIALIALIAVVLLMAFGFGVFGFAIWAFWTIAWYTVVGLVVGGLGRLVIPGRQNLTWFETALVGIAGALLGGIIGRRLLDVGWFGQFLCAVIVAALVLLAIGAGRSHEQTA
ncbi:MAG TPA: hypothetical protein VHR40_05325 [Thermoleophilaceae bacterium]|nr:hypothetical protein [Thermoleophilaceae bacterium]